MIISFCGHSQLLNREEIKKELFETIKKIARGRSILFYLGGYGDFDEIARQCCIKYKESHLNSKVIFVTPYLDESYLKKTNFLNGYDYIVYPSIENVPRKFAIIARNKYVIDESDFIIAKVDYGFGGAYKTLKYAESKNKKYINIGNLFKK